MLGLLIMSAAVPCANEILKHVEEHPKLATGARWHYERYDTKGSELVPELKVVSENVFEKSKASALTSEEFTDFIKKNDIEEFYLIGADATACVKSTSYNLVYFHL